MIDTKFDSPAERATKAAVALKEYVGIQDSDEADFRDLLTDLMHYASQHKLNFDAELAMARGNFDAEVAAEADK
jgi:hypothetical protein